MPTDNAGAQPVELERLLDVILERHIGSTCTAAVCLVRRGQGWERVLARGVIDPVQNPESVRASTSFDLASLTKLFISSAVLRLAAGGAISLDDPLQKHLHEFAGPGKREVTVEHLLTHSSGVPPRIKLYGPDAVPGDPRDALLNLQLISAPGAVVAYSDPGFMLLGHLLCRVTSSTLGEALEALVLNPLGLVGTSFGPRERIPATEWDSWRGRRISGEVHDENAAALGGEAGHAGLFGPAADLAALVRAYVVDGEGFLPPALARKALSERASSDGERRGLGWKLRSNSPGASEASFSESAFGHYGFTGTAVWSDPDRDVTVVLLTNRVYYGRERAGIQDMRQEVFDIVADSFSPEIGNG